MRSCLARLSLLLAAAGVAAALFVLVLDLLVMPRVVDVPLVIVPDLRGQDEASGRRQLEPSGLRLVRRDTLYHDTAPPGTILAQDPPPGLLVKRGRRVRVDLSLGQRYYAVPSTLAGVSLRQAELHLEAAHLRLGDVLHVSSDGVPAGVVIRSAPPAGTRLPRGTPVDLEVSSGRFDQPKTVPQLCGLPIAAVGDTLLKYEMRLGAVASAVVSNRPPGIVLEQTPAAGSQALRLTPVDVTITALPSLPEPTGEQPDLEMP